MNAADISAVAMLGLVIVVAVLAWHGNDNRDRFDIDDRRGKQ